MFKWLKLVSPADIFTLANAVVGFIAITYIIEGNLLFASFLIFVSILMDRLDGFIARKILSKHTKGRYLDSMADTISFCFAPALLIYNSFYNISLGAFYNGFITLTAVIVFAFGVLRLVRFSRTGYKLKTFAGVPTPAMAFFGIVISILFGNVRTLDSFSLPILSYEPLIAPILVVLVAFMMLVNIPFPKMRIRIRYIAIISSAALVYCIYIYTLFVQANVLWYKLLTYLLYLMLFIILVYLIIGPIYLTIKKR